LGWNRKLPPRLQNNLQEDKKVDIIEITHRREKKILLVLLEQIKEVKDFVQYLKMTTT
jgi:hypothetical protein